VRPPEGLLEGQEVCAQSHGGQAALWMSMQLAAKFLMHHWHCTCFLLRSLKESPSPVNLPLHALSARWVLTKLWWQIMNTHFFFIVSASLLDKLAENGNGDTQACILTIENSLVSSAPSHSCCALVTSCCARVPSPRTESLKHCP